MNKDQFLALSEPEKEELIWEEGFFLATYDEGDMIRDVYKLFDFYVTFSYELHKNITTNIVVHTYQEALPEHVLLNR
ncbi:MAG: hypothetical protein ABIN89_06770 [Chitinophagaceae bacterium]